MKKLAILFIAILQMVNVFAQSADELAILNALNSYRSKNGLPKVAYNKEISKAARHHAKYLSMCQERDLFMTNHDEPHRFYQWNSYSFDQRMSFLMKAGYDANGEVQWQSGLSDFDSDQIINAFHISPPHREIIKGRKSKLVGIGYVDGCTVIVFGNEL